MRDFADSGVDVGQAVGQGVGDGQRRTAFDSGCIGQEARWIYIHIEILTVLGPGNALQQRLVGGVAQGHGMHHRVGDAAFHIGPVRRHIFPAVAEQHQRPVMAGIAMSCELMVTCLCALAQGSGSARAQAIDGCNGIGSHACPGDSL